MHFRKFAIVAAAAIVLSVPVPASVAADLEPDYSSVIAALDSEIPQMMAQGHVVGLTVAIVDDQKVVMTKGYGLADRDANTPVTTDTLFHIGSLSKTFTATAVMQLVEQGKVDLDAPLARYVPSFRMLPRYKGNVITVRSVLDHHSGIPGDVFNGLITEGKTDPGFRSWLLKALAKMYPERRVNTEQAYNNSGFVLLQDLVENVTGQPFDTYTAEHLFARMGMQRSTFNDTLPPDSALTRNYLATEQSVLAKPREYVNGWSAGSILSSANDMANYLRMLNASGTGVAGQVIKPETLAQMLTPQTDVALDITPARFGLSWFVAPRRWTGFTYMHDGATAYNYSQLMMLRDSKLGVFVSANTANEMQVQAQVAVRALGLLFTAKTGISEPSVKPLPMAKASAPSKAVLAKREGIYASAAGFDRVVAVGHRLKYTPWAAEPMTLRRMSNGWWRAEATGTQWRFRTVQGRHLLLQRVSSPSGIQTTIVSEKATVQSIPKQWKNRLGTYRASNIVPGNIPDFVSRKITLRMSHGVLVLDRRDGIVEVLQPIRDDVAFTFGIGATGGRNKGDGVFAKGHTLTWMGVRYQR